MISENTKLIAVNPVEFILTQFKIGFFISLFLISPLIIYGLVVFLKPALNKKEKNVLKLILPLFIVLFLIGISFSYFVFLKIVLYFLADLGVRAGIENFWSINKFVEFVILTCFSFGLVFQMPLFLLVLNKLNILNIGVVRKNRKYAYVLMFILAAVVTPPDVLTMLILVVPLILLYEVSLLFARVF